MHAHTQPRFNLNPRQVVAAVHTWRGLALARRLAPGAVDLVEIRLDALAATPADLLRLTRLLGQVATPLLLTARDPREGGAQALSWARRRELLLTLLPHAAWLDLELRNAARAGDIIASAHQSGTGVVLSAHDFRRMPTLEQLRARARAATSLGADVFKFAGTADHLAQLAILVQWLAGKKRLPLAAMGMGAFGKISRLTLGKGGSILNYGFLDAANAPGQWPAPLLKKRLLELDL